MHLPQPVMLHPPSAMMRQAAQVIPSLSAQRALCSDTNARQVVSLIIKPDQQWLAKKRSSNFLVSVLRSDCIPMRVPIVDTRGHARCSYQKRKVASIVMVSLSVIIGVSARGYSKSDASSAVAYHSWSLNTVMQMQRMLPPHCSMESSAASDIHMRSSPVSTAVRDALAQQARMMSTSESPSPSSLSWSGLGIFAGSPSQPLQPRAQSIQTSAAQSPSRRQQFANRHSLVERYLRPPVASLPQQPPYSAQLASAHHPPGSAMAAAMQSTDNLPDHSVPLVTLPHLPQQQQHHMDSLQRIQQEPQSREGQHLQLLSGKPGALCRNSDTKQLNFQCTPEDRRSHSSCQ
jgi:hypothetical protein